MSMSNFAQDNCSFQKAARQDAEMSKRPRISEATAGIALSKLRVDHEYGCNNISCVTKGVTKQY